MSDATKDGETVELDMEKVQQAFDEGLRQCGSDGTWKITIGWDGYQPVLASVRKLDES